MSLTFPKKIAFRYLTSKRSEATISILTFFAVLGVAIGVIVLTVVMAVMTGFETELKNKILGADSHINVRSVVGNIENWEKVREEIIKVEGVMSVSPYTYHQALIQVGDRASGILIKGIEADSASGKQIQNYMVNKNPDAVNQKLFGEDKVAENVERQDPSDTASSINLPKIVIGRELSKGFSLPKGATVSLLSPQVGSTPFGLMPRFKRFEISGIYSSGLVEYEQGLAYVDLKDSQNFFRMNSNITGFEIRVKEIDKANTIAKKIISKLSANDLSRGLYAQDWTETNKPFFEALKLEQRVYFIVLLLIIVMASFSIVSSLIMVVLEKRKDIAVLRTMGATRSDISNIFKIQGAVIGALGVLIGIILGLAVCYALKFYGFPIDEKIFQMSKLPININFWNVLLVGVSAFTICFLATLYPSKKAAGMEPSKVLRFD